MSRTASVVLGAAVLAAAAAVTWWALSETAPEAPAAASAEPSDGLLAPERAREIAHRDAWPYGEFASVVETLRAETSGPAGEETERDLMGRNERAAYPHRVSVQFDQVSVRDLVVHLREQLKPAGVDVFTYDVPDVDHLRFDLHFDSIALDRLIDELRAQSDEQLRYCMTSLGLCLGSERAVQQAQLDAHAATAQRRARADRNAALLDAEFRPDFVGAWIGPIHRSIREQTGVEVVVDAAVWTGGRTMTWRADPMPLRQALDRICRSMGCVYRVRDGRVFLIAP